MTPLVKEMVKMVAVANLDPTQMQWFDVTGAIKEYIGYDQRKYLLHPAPYKNIMLCGRTEQGDFMLSVLAESEATVVTGWITDYNQFGIYNSGVVTIPAWATHIRITAGIVMDAMTPNTAIIASIVRGSTQVARATTVGLTEQSWPAICLQTGILPLSAGSSFTMQIYHRDTEARNVIAGASTYMNYELFESL